MFELCVISLVAAVALLTATSWYIDYRVFSRWSNEFVDDLEDIERDLRKAGEVDIPSPTDRDFDLQLDKRSELRELAIRKVQRVQKAIREGRARDYKKGRN